MDNWTQSIDLAFNLAVLGYILCLTGLAVARWVRRGRVEAYSEADLIRRATAGGGGAIGWLLAASLLLGMIGWAIHAI